MKKKNHFKSPVLGTKKADKGKVSYSSIPQLSLREVAKVMTYGKNKYGKFNYSKGIEYTRLYDACQRHLTSWLMGENIDESKTNHLANAAANLLMLLDQILTNVGKDDRNSTYRKKNKGKN